MRKPTQIIGQDALSQLIFEGYAVVPAQPTEAMIDAALGTTAAWRDIKGSALTVNREKMRLRFCAMIRERRRNR